MVNQITAEESASDYAKVPNFTGLYRHTKNGRYYAVKTIKGKRRERSLRTTDRQIAERRMRDWIANIHRVDREKERTTLWQLIATFVATNSGKSKSTQTHDRSMIKQLRQTWRFGFDVEVREIRPSHLDEWLAIQEARLKNTSYNSYARFLKEMFDIAVKDRIIAQSPFTQVKTSWKKPQTPIRLIPTKEQFQAIVQTVRSQRFTDHAKESADFVEFLGLAGLGQAEASSLKWADIDWKRERLSIRRRKTEVCFFVPIYSDLRPLLECLAEEANDPSPNRLVFAIKDAKKALRAACNRLGYPQFSQRSLRRFRIGQLWRARVDPKLIAKWQGHRDGGKLIIDTYTEVFGDDDAEYERHELAKIDSQGGYKFFECEESIQGR